MESSYPVGTGRVQVKIAVIGGGIFGVTTAIVLAKNGFSVDLYEKENDIFTHATGTNQYRLHRGYHYPRSSETILSCMHGEKEFREMFDATILDNGIEHYYGIAKEGSKINGKEYEKVLNNYNLEYRIADSGIVNMDKLSLCIKVKEYLYDPDKLKTICWDYLNNTTNVNVKLSNEANQERILHEGYDLVVIATYSDNNSWLSENAQRDYQYEVCEKLVLKLPNKYRNKSVVILDGAFMCIDPFGKTEYHCMGNVVHAVHQTTIGKGIKVDKKYKEVLNKGIINNPPFTNYNKFMESAEEYFPGISESAIHVGSMFTIRTVLPYRDHDDARPTIVEQFGDDLITIFSGKIPTCVEAANQVLKIALNRTETSITHT